MIKRSAQISCSCFSSYSQRLVAKLDSILRNPALAAQDAHKNRLMTAVVQLNLTQQFDTVFLQSAVESICQSRSDVLASQAQMLPQSSDELTGRVRQAQDCVVSLQFLLCDELHRVLRTNIDSVESIRTEVSLFVETAKEAAHGAQKIIERRIATQNESPTPSAEKSEKVPDCCATRTSL